MATEETDVTDTPPRLIDLSMPIEEHWRFRPTFQPKYTPRPQFTFHTTQIGISSHGFSHVDAPLHNDPEGISVDEIGLEHFYGPASLVDVSDLGDNKPIGCEVLEPRSGHVRAGDILLIRSDQESRHPTTTKDYWTTSPWISLSGAQYLATLDLKAVAFDFPQDRSIRVEYDPDHVPAEDPDEDEACHVTLLPRGVLQFEYLQNFSAIIQPRFLFMGFPLRLKGVDGSPVRAVALEGEGLNDC